ncbi:MULTISPECIES: TetR/AcrR family transcriptional regulator [unclassified Bacillus (in: firmicutes)]|uniref:TetR/AcrR family transcriptional regulator n=1 Tax=unclassified Bacillus (in: firmicutes) TaxID=185979 RepID=UPI001BEB7947|nr:MULTISPECIES: TetR/AcrR family transcriptional regulator [unclassified Bacillus (in: firmicutes)]MBT2618879.1 TetR/AcrR family transcriptional regulator [Bacillus sp. ISL-78]MBT2627855.1 TetR/AcrR family transcriptional regulator [Bacillus sp. ISL-101]
MTKDEIKAIAVSYFGKHGYEGTSLSDIAKEVGIKKPSIYNHFTGKDELFLCVFEEVVWETVRQIEGTMKKTSHLSIEDRLYHILNTIFEYFMYHEEKSNFIKRSIMFPPEHLKVIIKEKFFLSEEPLSCILRTLFTEGIETGVIRRAKVEDLVVAYYCLLDGLFMHLSYYAKDGVALQVQNVWKNFLTGIINNS